jgi:UDP-4-amino-4-deoxy-L-arabinose formyltransferase/UDP-glucuronic acid dehydrogenase (UDP-4-keto-hexauronic acid decarboxylating)
MKAVVLAYHNIGCVGIEALLEQGIEIAAVFTHTDDPNESMWFDSVAELAAGHGIPVFAPDNINHPLWVEKIRSLAPDILFSFYYRDMVAPPILEIPPSGCLNLHGSLLPRYRGRCPINWVLVNGETETGVTLHHMTPRPDDGDIVGQRPIPIAADDTALTLHRKAAGAAAALLDELLPPIIAGTAPRQPQDKSLATYFGGRTPRDGEIDWTRPASAVRNLVRAVTRPYPGAFSHIGNRKCLILVRPRGEGGRGLPGTVLSVSPFIIRCAAGAVEVLAGQADGGVTQSGPQLARELGLVEGMRFGTCRKSTFKSPAKKAC